MRKFLHWLKEQVITFFGYRASFSLFILGQRIQVGYSLRNKIPDRDYSIILQLTKNKRCIFDVGANHGIISLMLAARDSGVSVHLFEASEAATNIINYNSLLNGFEKNFCVVNALIADQSGKIIPFYWAGSSGGASIVKGRLGHIMEVQKVTLSLDDYARTNRLSPEFIKMDIEGAENIAIRGMSFIMQEIRPEIFIELHDFGDKKLFQNAQEILDFARSFDYLMIYLRSGQPIQSADILRERGRCHVLLMPKEHYKPDYFNTLDLSGL